LKSGYDEAKDLAARQLARIAPEIVCECCGVTYESEDFFIPWMGERTALSTAPDWNKILFLHYLTSQGNKKLSNRLISYRDVAGARFYEPNFIKRAINPLVKRFGKNPQNLIEEGERFGGVKSDKGDASIVIKVLPYISVTFIIWKGDDEFPPEGNILFDETAKSWLPAEDLVVLASLCVYKLIA